MLRFLMCLTIFNVLKNCSDLAVLIFRIRRRYGFIWSMSVSMEMTCSKTQYHFCDPCHAYCAEKKISMLTVGYGCFSVLLWVGVNVSGFEVS